MWPFKIKKKTLYKLTWTYGSEYAHYSNVYTDFIRATDVADAWRKHKKDHPIATYCIEIEVVNENGNSQII